MSQNVGDEDRTRVYKSSEVSFWGMGNSSDMDREGGVTGIRGHLETRHKTEKSK